ncbi:hypothetical protein GCM10025777_06790 [Membranihabitans marinus]
MVKIDILKSQYLKNLFCEPNTSIRVIIKKAKVLYTLKDNVIIKTAPNNIIAMNGQIEIPFLNRTKLNAKNTKADPISGCNKINKIGAEIIIKDINIDRKLSSFTEGFAKKLLKDRQVANLANSEGCKENPPKLIHDLAPLISEPKTKTSNSNNRLSP